MKRILIAGCVAIAAMAAFAGTNQVAGAAQGKKDVEVDLEKGIVRCGDIIEELYHDEKNAYVVFSKLVGTEACPSNCYCDVYRMADREIDIRSPENQFLAQYWDVVEDDAQSDDCLSGCFSWGYHYPPSWEEKDLFTNRVEYARIVDDIIASNEVVAAMIQKASRCSIYDSETNGVDTSALISVMRGYGCARIHRMIETGRTSEAVAALRQFVRIGELVIKGRASIDEKCMGMAIIRNAQEVARLSIPFLSKNELLEMALLFKLDGPMYGVDMHEDIVHGYLRNDMLRIEIAEALRRRFGVEWSDEIKYLHRRIMQAYDEDICTAFQTRCYREGIGVVANVKRADEMVEAAVNYTYRKMESYLDANPLVPAKDEDKKKGRKWDLKHSIWRYMYGTDATDAWGRQFKYHWGSKTGYLTIMSSGGDGEWGTDDDLEKTAHADTSNHTRGEDR